MSAPRELSGVERVTRWERAAETRWGAYLTAVEREALLLGSSLVQPSVSLDIGCGSGRWSLLLRERGWKPTCVDVDREALELCRSRMPDAVCISVDEDADRLPVADAAVGLVAAIEVPQVMEQPWLPAELDRVLASGGVVVCTYHNPRSARALAYRALRRRHPFYRGPSYSRFRRTLAAAGIRPLYETGLGWFPFSRESDSRLVPVFTTLEAMLRLRRLVSLSPWVVLVAQKDASRS